MSALHHFDASFERGLEGEARLDDLFRPWFAISPASDIEQRRGIDRWFVGRKTGWPRSVEYKTDYRTGQTGNVFIETSSVDGKRAGWAQTSEAEWLVYYVAPHTAYLARMAAVRDGLARWAARFPERRVYNDGYTSRGVIVPAWEFARCAFWKAAL